MHLRKSSQLRHEVSIDEPLNVDWDGNELLLSDLLGTDPDTVNRGHRAGGGAGHALPRRWTGSRPGSRRSWSCALAWAASKEHTQKEVADQLGISQSYISRLEKRIIHRLRRDLEKAG